MTTRNGNETRLPTEPGEGGGGGGVDTTMTIGFQEKIERELVKRGYLEVGDSEGQVENRRMLAEYIVVMMANQKSKQQVNDELKELVGEVYEEGFADWLWDGSSTPSEQDPHGEREQDQQGERELEWARGRDERVRERERGGERERERSQSPLATSNRSIVVRQRDYPHHQQQQQQQQQRRERRYQPKSVWKDDDEQDLFSKARNSRLAMDDPTLPQPSSIVTFPRPQKIDQKPVKSILARLSIPDPRAAEFHPSTGFLPVATTSTTTTAPSVSSLSSSSFSLLSRIDPMIPSNLTSTAPSTESLNEDITTFAPCRYYPDCTNRSCTFAHPSPANPQSSVTTFQSCQFNLRCTNSTCTRSHPSPSLTIAISTTSSSLSIDQPLPSDPSFRPCKFGLACTRSSCFFSHPITISSNSSSSTTTTSTTKGPCRFGFGCNRVDCYYIHPPGHNPALVNESSTHGMSHRFQIFSKPDSITFSPSATTTTSSSVPL